ncbi:MAG: DNA-binding protein [Silanimonas sp.]|nr:MAG: DNA-binding protein [Silanimonas sp.]
MNKAERSLRTPAEVRADFERRGQSIRAWARAHGLLPETVYQVLSGAKRGRRGEAHRAAVLLGLKDGVIERPESAA